MSFALRGLGYRLGLVGVWAAVGAGLSTNATAAAPAPALTVPVALVSLANDPRYAPRRLELAYPGHPTGRILDAAQMALNDTALELQESGVTLVLREFSLTDAAELPKILATLKTAGVHHVVADLPTGLLEPLARQAPVALGGAMVFNTSADDDALRNAKCAPALLHTTPSRAMLTDALAQYLAARNWRKLLLLQGPLPADQLQGAALQLSAKKFGLKVLQTKPFKLSGDPRERDLFNTRLLTNDRDHDVVAVADSEGEFARTLPYATQWPRPVLGSNGLMAMAWHTQWERNGGPQVSRRFQKLGKRPMQSQDWAAWMAVKAVAAAVSDNPKASAQKQLVALLGGDVFVDGSKGPRLSFRAWDGQLRQPILLGHGDGVVGVAPLDGVLHPTEVMDTLGTDQKESQCKTRP